MRIHAGRSRRWIVAMLVVPALVACSTPGTSSDPEPSPGSSSESTASAVPSSLDLTDVDEELVTELQEQEGVGEGAAVFLALTRTDVEPLGDHTARITHAFPTGNTADMTVTLFPDQVAAEPAAPPTVTELASDDGFAFRFEYHVPYEGMPQDVLEAIRGTGRPLPPVTYAGLRITGGQAAPGDGVTVVIEAEIKAFAGRATSTFVRYLETRLGTGVTLDNLYKALKAGMSVKDSLALRAEFEALMGQIDKLEECARNPTNEVTRRTYRERPEELQRILDRIEAVRLEVTANTTVSYIGLLNKTASGAIRGVPWLSYVVGPATAWSKATLDDLNAQLIADLRDSIPPCGGFALDFSRNDIPLRTLSVGTDATTDITGHINACPTDTGWSFSGTAQLVTEDFNGTRTSEFKLFELTGRGTPEAFTLDLSPFETPEVHRQFYANQIANTVAIIDARGTPTGQVTLYNGFSERIGDFDLTIVKAEPECEESPP